MIRNRWKKGNYLIIDAESGMTRYDDQVKMDYTGEYITKRYADYEQPQDFVRAEKDPYPIPFSNPSEQDFEVASCITRFVGNTSVETKFGPASHLFGECP